MKRLSMRKIRDALRLRADGRTLREIGESLGLGRTTIGDHLQRAARAGLTWPLDEGLTDAAPDGYSRLRRPAHFWRNLRG